MPKHNSGFTLIELLVAMSILAILSVIGLVAYTSTQKSARDGIRRQQIEVIANSIEAKKSPIDSTYTYTSANLSDEFDNTLSATAQIGKDPSGWDYCIAVPASATSTVPPVSTTITWTGNLCTAANSKIIPGDLITTPPGSFKAWTLCTKLENPISGGPTVYCRSSLTR